MSNQEQIERLADLAKTCHQIERHMKELQYADSQSVRQQVAATTYELGNRITAHLEHARMYAGDLLRLAVLKCDHRNPGFFNVGEHGGRFNDAINLYDEPLNFIKWAKQELRELFYHVCEAAITDGSFLMMPEKVSTPEWGCYSLALRQHLKEADQCLGLWLGEISSADKAPPPSNAKGPLSFQSFAEADRQNEQLFTDIMEELGTPIPCSDEEEKEGVVGMYKSQQVEQVLRRRLGLRNPQSAIQNPKS